MICRPLPEPGNRPEAAEKLRGLDPGVFYTGLVYNSKELLVHECDCVILLNAYIKRKHVYSVVCVEDVWYIINKYKKREYCHD